MEGDIKIEIILLLKYTFPLVLGFLSGILPSIFSNKREGKCLKREKLENLYKDITDWYNSFFAVYLDFTLVFNGHRDWDTYNDIISSSEKKGDHIKPEIEICMYFPALKKNFDELLLNVQSLYQFIDTEIKNAYVKNSDVSKYKPEIGLRINSCNKKFNDLKERILAEAKQI